MSLSVVQFYSLKPHLPFRFKVDWYVGFWDVKQREILSYSVTSVTLPKMEIENGTGFSYFGDSFINKPTFSPGTRKLDITFEETDYMLITRTMDELMKRSYSKKPYYITIAITQFDEHFHRNITTGYVCHLTSYEEPQFKRDGQAQAITVNASFIVDTVLDSFKSEDAVTGNIDKKPTGYNDKIDNLTVDLQNEEFRFGNLMVPVDTSKFGGGSYKKLSQFTSSNKDRETNYNALVGRMKTAGVDTTSTSQVVSYLTKEGYITENYNKEQNGLCATSTYLVAAITTGQPNLGSVAGHGEKQDLSRFGYKKINSGVGSASLEKQVKKLKEGDVINIKYADGSEYGHAVTVVRKKDGSLGFVSDFKQNTIHGQVDEKRVGSWYIQRKT